MKKFIKDLFTKPVRSTEFNPGRRRALGGAAVGAAAVAVGAKHAIKQAPEAGGRSKEVEELIVNAFEGNQGRSRRLPIPIAEAKQLGLNIKTTKRPFVGSGGESRLQNKEYGFVDPIDYYRAGGKGRFVVAKHRVPEFEDAHTDIFALPNSWKPPAQRITAEQADNMFPHQSWVGDGLEFESGKSVVDIMDMSRHSNSALLHSHVLDSKWQPVRPQLKKMKKELEQRARNDIVEYKQDSLLEMGDPFESGWDQRSWKEHVDTIKDDVRQQVKDERQRIREEITETASDYRESKSLRRGMYKGH